MNPESANHGLPQSNDGGINWTFRSKLSSHAEEPQGIRMNHAVGLNADDHLVALVSGYRRGQKLPMLKLQRCISKDHGKTWDRQLLGIDIVPHGDIFKLPNGHLVCPAYRKLDDRPGHFRASVIFSNDGGKTWSEPKLISPQGQENAHILELKDGRLLCSFTSRIPGLFGVVMRMSSDGGATWSLPVLLISTPARDWHKTDCGYPSSIQLEDGSIVTAYDFGPKRPEWAAYGLPWHQRYHMGIAKWDLSVWPDSAPINK